MAVMATVSVAKKKATHSRLSINSNGMSRPIIGLNANNPNSTPDIAGFTDNSRKPPINNAALIKPFWPIIILMLVIGAAIININIDFLNCGALIAIENKKSPNIV